MLSVELAEVRKQLNEFLSKELIQAGLAPLLIGPLFFLLGKRIAP